MHVMRFINEKIHLSFSRKLFVYLVLISIIPVFALGVIAYTVSMRMSLSNLQQNSAAVLHSASAGLNRSITEYQSALDFFCKSSDVVDMIDSKDPDDSVIYQKMYTMLAGKQQLIQMHIIKADNSYSISTAVIPSDYNIKTHDDWGVYRLLKGTDISVVYSNRFTSPTGIDDSITIAHNIRKNGTVIGFAILDIPKEIFKTALTSANSIYQVSYTVFDSHNYLLYSDTETGIFLSQSLQNDINASKRDKRFYLSSKNKLVVWDTINRKNPITVMASVPYGMITDSANYIAVITIIVALLTIILLLFILPLVIRNLTRPLNRIVSTMQQVQSGNTLARVPIQTQDEFGFIGTNLNKTLDKMDELYQTNLEKQDSLRVAEIKALFSQINPHFLYNTLDSIKWLAKLKNTDDIVIMVSQLGKLLKYTINNRNNLIHVSEELALVKSYLSIQKYRYGDKFEPVFDIEDGIMHCIIPKLIIQPLVENAIIHGIENKIGSAILTISGFMQDGKIIFEVTDDGVGMSPVRLEEVRGCIEGQSSKNVGLSNVHKRIKLYYGEEYGLTIESTEHTQTKVRIAIPYMDAYSES